MGKRRRGTRNSLGVLGLTAVLVLVSALPAEAAFPGDNGRIAFTTYQYDGNGNIYSVQLDGTGLTRLTADPGSDDDAAWSPNGRRIAFTSNRAHPEEACAGLSPRCDYDIYVMRADGTEVTRLTDSPGSDRDPAWSPDGTRIVFSSTRDYTGTTFGESYTSELYVMNGDGSGETRITNIPGIDQNAAWSPNGTRIAFKSGACEFNCGSNISTIAPDGSGLQALTGIQVRNSNPNWAPDGSKIVFQREFASVNFWLMNPDGTGHTIIPNPRMEPAWSPDGQRIAFGYPGIGHQDPDGGSPTLVHPVGNKPDWQPLVPGPRREDFNNGPAFCRAEREYLGEAEFRAKYGGGSNAYGKCVSGNR